MTVIVKLETTDKEDLKEVIEVISAIEKEYNINCTLEVSWG